MVPIAQLDQFATRTFNTKVYPEVYRVKPWQIGLRTRDLCLIQFKRWDNFATIMYHTVLLIPTQEMWKCENVNFYFNEKCSLEKTNQMMFYQIHNIFQLCVLVVFLKRPALNLNLWDCWRILLLWTSPGDCNPDTLLSTSYRLRW